MDDIFDDVSEDVLDQELYIELLDIITSLEEVDKFVTGDKCDEYFYTDIIDSHFGLIDI